MEQNFEYQTLDQALEGGLDREKIKSLDPEGIGPETKKVMQEVYDRRAQFGENDKRVDFTWDSQDKSYAVHRAAGKVKSRELEDAASLGDVYVYTAIDVAQSLAYDILHAREEGSCDRAIVEYLKADKADRSPFLTFWWNVHVLGVDRTYRMIDAVFEDLGFTVEEAERLSGQYQIGDIRDILGHVDSFVRQTEDFLGKMDTYEDETLSMIQDIKTVAGELLKRTIGAEEFEKFVKATKSGQDKGAVGDE